MNSQNAELLAYLKTGKPITQLQALKLLGIGRLAARAHNLRADGHPVKSELMTDRKSGKRYGIYWIAPTAPNLGKL